MTTLTYTLIFLGVLCAGTCLGFFLASLLKIGVNDKEIISQQVDVIDNLSGENDKLKKENAELVNNLWEIEEVVKKYFGPGVG